MRCLVDAQHDCCNAAEKLTVEIQKRARPNADHCLFYFGQALIAVKISAQDRPGVS